MVGIGADSIPAESAVIGETIELMAVVDGCPITRSELTAIALVVGVRATQNNAGVALIRDGGEVGNNVLNGAGSEIVPVKLISVSGLDVLSSDVGHGFGCQVAQSNGITFGSIIAFECGALPEVESPFGNLVGDGDGDGTGGVDLNGVV